MMTDTPVYVKLVQDMDFDPEGMALAFGPPENWNLHEDHPIDVMTRIKDMAAQLGWTQEQLEQEWAWMSWLFEHERSESDADTPAQQEAASPGHPGPETSSAAVESPTRELELPGPQGPDSGSESGQAEQVSG